MMTWICKKFDCNRQIIKDCNILEYAEEKIKKLKKGKTFEEFSEELKAKMMLHYWSRCEYELIIEKTENGRIILKPWAGCYNPEEVKIDVTEDDSFDWKSFAELHIRNQIFDNSAKIDIYGQLLFRWNEFVGYCWNFHHKYERKKRYGQE